MTERILIVEDDPDLRRGVVFNLSREGYAIEEAADGREALSKLERRGVDLILLDLNLPDIDGLDILRQLRETSDLPVICLTARGQESDVVMGLKLGADDYVAKPFGVAELLARVAAVLRRGQGSRDRGTLRLGDATVDFDAHRVSVAGRDEELTPIERDLLRYLLDRRGRAVKREELLKELWGLSHKNSSRTLDNHVARLRRKVEVDPARPRLIVTVHGVGYRLQADG